MHELSITRHIAAPPALVWDVLVNRQAEWFCPHPWRAVPGHQDRRAGGVCEMVMHGPNGEVMPNNGVYLAWDEGRRFAVTDAVTGDLQPAGPFMIGIWEIAAEGNGTRYTATARHWTEDACAQHAAMGFTAGWGAAADQLAALCEG
ncbi:ATPase [Novosphingobium sp. FSY-8]|uniref:ATPase n=1 Tax=Novosphingobium ovatum TaxID=1908523 RepID=A0ABW9XAZ5_9SPHN|nr:SRPBCC domain-containing protein [Novosphingobium ovatum]NBC35670.1 ATPase [Novosphingobium ovatum]